MRFFLQDRNKAIGNGIFKSNYLPCMASAKMFEQHLIKVLRVEVYQSMLNNIEAGLN
jgi:hypothetical protein